MAAQQQAAAQAAAAVAVPGRIDSKVRAPDHFNEDKNKYRTWLWTVDSYTRNIDDFELLESR